MKLKLLFAICAFVIQTAFGQTPDFSKEIKIVYSGWKEKKYEIIKPLLDDSVKISSLPRGMNDAVIPQVIAQMPCPESYTLFSSEKQGTNTRVIVSISRQGKTMQDDFLFNEQRKLVEMNILGNAVAVAQEMALPSKANSIFPDELTIPFTLKGKLILVEAEINGEKGKFILDSGAPVLILNEKESKAGARGLAQGINGAIKTGTTKVSEFNWQGIRLKDFDCFTMDLSHLGENLKGLIGYDVFKEYEITFDYFSKTIKLVKTDSLGNYLSDRSRTTPICTSTIGLTQHIATVKTKIGDKEYNMGLDCGAEENLLYEKKLQDVKSVCGRMRKSKLKGADKLTRRVKSTKIKEASICSSTFKNTRTVFSNESLDQLNNGYHLQIDGLIGYEFLKQYVTTINYKKRTINFYEKGKEK